MKASLSRVVLERFVFLTFLWSSSQRPSAWAFTSQSVVPISARGRLVRTSYTTSLDAAARRRDVFAWVKKAALFGGSVVGLTTAPSASSAVSTVKEVDSAAGRIATFSVNNLDGVPGNTGTFQVQLQPDWAPLGVERFEKLVSSAFYNENRVFRVVPGFVVQFGINGSPSVQSEWRSKNFRDDPVKVSNERGTLVFATAGKDSRTTQIFINTREQGNAFLDSQGFAPIGRVLGDGMSVVDRMYAGYGEGSPKGNGPSQGRIQLQGNSYLKENYPNLSYISTAQFKES